MRTISARPESSTSRTNLTQHKRATRKILAAGLLAMTMALPGAAQTAGTYAVTNLFSDGSVAATITDPGFINPWGVTNATFWINAQGTGFDYVVSPTNFPPFTPPAKPAFAFKISIPAATGGSTATGQPTGAASTGSATGFLLPNGVKATFLFCSLDGIVTGWNNGLGTNGAVAQVAINNNAAGAVYTSMALITNTTSSFILAANFGKGATIEVYDNKFASAKLAGSFTDPNLPAGYVPYAVHAIGTQVFVTYALRGSTGGPTVGSGNGILNIFDTSGNFVSRAVSPGGNLNAPWGVAVAPATFGVFANDILVGNFGDGIINAYDPKTFAFLGQLADGTGKTIVNASLWEIFFGLTAATSTAPSNQNTLYIAAGLDQEKHGLLAAINTNPTATGTATYGFSASSTNLTVSNGSTATAVVSAVPTNNFSGTVALSCTGLPLAAKCSFSPASLTVSASAPATSTVTISTVKPMVALQPRTLRGATRAGLTLAFVLPFGAFLSFSRRRSPNRQSSVRLVALFGILIVGAGFIAGCSTTSNAVPSTPTGSSQVTIKATSGSITQSTVINLTVQ